MDPIVLQIHMNLGTVLAFFGLMITGLVAAIKFFPSFKISERLSDMDKGMAILKADQETTRDKLEEHEERDSKAYDNLMRSISEMQSATTSLNVVVSKLVERTSRLDHT